MDKIEIMEMTRGVFSILSRETLDNVARGIIVISIPFCLIADILFMIVVLPLNILGAITYKIVTTKKRKDGE